MNEDLLSAIVRLLRETADKLLGLGTQAPAETPAAPAETVPDTTPAAPDFQPAPAGEDVPVAPAVEPIVDTGQGLSVEPDPGVPDQEPAPVEFQPKPAGEDIAPPAAV